MSIQDELEAAIAIVNGLPDRRRGRAFAADVERCVAFLASIPDNKVADITEAVAMTLRHEADRLVEYVENRLERGGDGASVQQRLASSVYGVRRNMEQVEMWLRHYRGDSKSD